MNNSGRSVASLSKYYQVDSRNIWVIHDDLDLPLFRLKISRDASSGGHKGVQSIIESLGLQIFVRFRMGIAPFQTPKKIPAERYVLQRIPRQFKTAAKNCIQYAGDAVAYALEHGVDNAMNRYNR